MDKPRYEIRLYNPVPNSPDVVTRVAKHLTDDVPLGDNLIQAPRNTLVLNTSDIQNGSLQINSLNPGAKFFFLKCTSAEAAKTRQLQEAGIVQVMPYEGSLTVNDGRHFLFGSMTPGAINLSLVKLSDAQPTEYFGTFDVLEQVAKIAATIRKANLAQGNFRVENFVLTTDTELPLVLYNNAALKPQAGETDDVEDFFSSLRKNSPNDPHESQREFFAQKYRQYLLAK